MDKKILKPLMLIKYLFSLFLLIVLAKSSGNIFMLLASAVELLFIIVFSNYVLYKNKYLGNIGNSILILLYNIQLLIYFFSNSFLSMVMITNMEFIKGISGKTTVYILGVIICIIISFLPIDRLTLMKNNKNSALLQIGVYFMEVVLVLGFLTPITPFSNYVSLGKKYFSYSNRKKEIQERKVEDNCFNKSKIESGIKKDKNLAKYPNIVIIFTEGLSTNVINDQRLIMSNVKSWREKSITFEKYFNHTSPTLRGLIGQLYSGYQNDNYDTNKLVSLQGILKDRGYITTFINTEPCNEWYTAYLNSLGFDNVIGNNDRPLHGYDGGSFSDKEAYDFLFQTMQEYNNSDTPFFIGIYTFGTHATFDSIDEKFGDCSSNVLNKFYDADVWYGEFMEKYTNSEMIDNTIVVFTTDHCTYGDNDFTHTFPQYKREHYFCDEIPFFIYYKGVEPKSYNANGRNSLCMVPTICDLLDISTDNYFLGSSLFVDKCSKLESYYTEPGTHKCTEDGIIRDFSDDELEWFENQLLDYYSFSVGEPSVEQ